MNRPKAPPALRDVSIHVGRHPVHCAEDLVRVENDALDDPKVEDPDARLALPLQALDRDAVTRLHLRRSLRLLAVLPTQEPEALSNESLVLMVDIKAELIELLDLLEDRLRQRSFHFEVSDVPLRVHATYARDEIMAAFGVVTPKGKVLGLQQGVYNHKPTQTDLFLITLEKSEKEYSPTTLYNDYPISPSLFHWESQGATREKSKMGQRYINHTQLGGRILLFVRSSKNDDRGETRPYVFLGSAHCQSHSGECPIQFVWRLDRPMPARLFDETKIAAG